MGVGIDMYMQEGISMDIRLLNQMIVDAQNNDENGEYIRGLIEALNAIIEQKRTFPWD